VGDEKELRFIGLRLDGARHLASRAQKARSASRQTATFVALFIVFFLGIRLRERFRCPDSVRDGDVAANVVLNVRVQVIGRVYRDKQVEEMVCFCRVEQFLMGCALILM
jgi:hypothetical protein